MDYRDKLHKNLQNSSSFYCIIIYVYVKIHKYQFYLECS